VKWHYILISVNIDVIVKSVVAESVMLVVFAILQALDKILPFINQFHLRSCIASWSLVVWIQALIYTYFISSVPCGALL
jgi:hypothetical protein